MYDKILFPTDGSEGAEVVKDHVFDLAEKYDADLHVFYVVDVRADTTGDLMANMMGRFEEIGEEATESIRQEAEERSINTITEIGRGIPHEEILSYSEENDVDLIAMGTHGRTGLDRILLGSVTEKVVRASEVPVMTIGRNE